MRAGNDIGEAGAEHVAGAIRENTTLTTLILYGACPTPPFRALFLCCCFGACSLLPPLPLPPPSLDAHVWLRGLTVSGGVC